MAIQQALVDNIDDILAVLHNSVFNEPETPRQGVPTPKAPTQQRTASDLFGNRYGMDLSNKKPRPPAKPIPLNEGDVGVTSSSGPPSITQGPDGKSKTSDPALRVKLFEFLTNTWPCVQRDDELPSRLHSVKPTLVKYFRTAAVTEVWSIRRVALSALGAILNASATKEEVVVLVRIISECLNERKFLQVRKSALECLLSILKKANMDILRELKLEIRKILILGTSDSQAEVAGTASNVQVIFTQLLQ